MASTASVAGHTVTRRVTHYRELSAGEPGLLLGSLGTIEISLDGADLARKWNVKRGAEVRIALALCRLE
jgi:S-adenosylmethionine hydrolase